MRQEDSKSVLMLNLIQQEGRKCLMPTLPKAKKIHEKTYNST